MTDDPIGVSGSGSCTMAGHKAKSALDGGARK